MKPTIAALWRGNLSDSDCFVYTNPIMDALAEDIERIGAQFAAGLDGEQAADFAAYVKAQKDLIELSCEQAFINGFRVAARMLGEVYAAE